MNIVTKQLIVNELALPTETIHIIKEYCFYNIIEETNKKKLKINNLILNANCSRLRDGDSDSKWLFAFLYYNIIQEERLHIGGSNCQKCGEFCYTIHSYFPKNRRCLCPRDEED